MSQMIVTITLPSLPGRLASCMAAHTLAPAEMPVFAAWQPAGTVIVTSRNERGAVEIDRAGKTVWSYRVMTRVTRAIRH